MSARLIYFVAVCSFVALAGCSSTGDSGGYDENSYESEQGNPYANDSGHGAGYDWAERTGGSCNGNSASFNEGCEAFYEQTQ